jgi:hypothetical protein
MFQSIPRYSSQDSGSLIQPALEIGKEDDEHEKEADSVAEKVMKMPDPGLSIQKMEDGKKEEKMNESGNKIQMMVDSPLKISKMSQGAENGIKASPNVEHNINTSKGKGHSLDADLQNELGSKMDADLGHVNIHTDANAITMNKEIGAKAFTHGNDIYFNQGQYNTSTYSGKHLLAHEITHTLQQSKGIKPKIQRVKTWGGEWTTGEYVKQSSGNSRGAKIDLFFKPGIMVNAELIGLIQTAQAIRNNSVHYIGEPTREKHAIKGGDVIETDKKTHSTDEGTHIDQAAYNRNPLYAAEGAPSTDVNLYDTMPPKDADDKWIYGHHGWRYLENGKDLKKEDAELIDTPIQENVARNSSNIFEVAALAIKGGQKGTYYGSVRWGWKTDNAGNHTLIPLEKVSDGVPSSSFIKAAEIWNKETTDTGVSTLDLPIVDVKVLLMDFIIPAKKIPYANVTLKKGTRVQVIRQTYPYFFNYDLYGTKKTTEKPNVKVVDGPYTNQEFYVPDIYLNDERK